MNTKIELHQLAISAAAIVREWNQHPGNEWAAQAICEAFAALLTRMHPLFDVHRFRESCELRREVSP